MTPRFFRVRQRVLQAPVVRYRHRRSGQVVTLITVAHMADARYYQTILGLILRLEAAGAVVQFEMIGYAGEEEWAAASDGERAALEACRRSQQRRLAAAGYLGWVSQHDALAPAAGWQNTDMTDLEYIRAVGPEVILDGERRTEKSMAALGDHAGRVLGMSAAVFWRLIAADRWQVMQWVMRRVDPVLERVTVADRSARAVSHLPPDRDAVMIWGAGHLESIDTGLRRLGYVRTVTRWIPLGRLPAVYVVFRDLLGALAAVARTAQNGMAGCDPAGPP